MAIKKILIICRAWKVLKSTRVQQTCGGGVVFCFRKKKDFTAAFLEEQKNTAWKFNLDVQNDGLENVSPA